jgi:hypothetical protein
MLVRQSGIIARVAFLVCGMLSVLLGRAYLFLKSTHFTPGPWGLFSAVTIVAGGFSIVLALLPSRWMQSERKVSDGNSHQLDVPLRVLAAFAAASFLITAVLAFAPLGWHPSPEAAFAVCPACVLTITVDPSPISVIFILAPLSAAAYGSLGGALGYVFARLHQRPN